VLRGRDDFFFLAQRYRGIFVRVTVNRSTVRLRCSTNGEPRVVQYDWIASKRIVRRRRGVLRSRARCFTTIWMVGLVRRNSVRGRRHRRRGICRGRPGRQFLLLVAYTANWKQSLEEHLKILERCKTTRSWTRQLMDSQRRNNPLPPPPWRT
jgi:hypothetical protein